MKPKISVVIPHLNQPDMLARCLETVCNQTMPRTDYEVIVVDNGSAQMPTEICDRYNAKLLLETEPGPGPARNKGIAASTTELMAFIDSDCLADNTWLLTAYAALSDPNVQIVGGDVRIAYVDPKNLTALEAYESVFGYRQKLYIERMGFSATLNMGFKRLAFEQVGPFGGIGIAEDRDWGLRASKFGLKIRYVSEMRVFTPARKTFEELKTKWRRHIVHDLADARNSYPRLLLWCVKAVVIGVSPAGGLLTILSTDRIGGMKARLKGFEALLSIRLFRAFTMIRMLVDPRVDGKPKWNTSEADPK